MTQRKILLLENVASQAAGVRDHLDRAGYQVAVSRYEADGLRRLSEWSPDLVLVSTAHPAGDFSEYCRRARALAPAARLVVTAPMARERFLREYPGLQGVVSGFLSRPYGHQEVVALLEAVPVPAPPPAPAPPTARPAQPAAAAAPAQIGALDDAELRADFQRQLEAKFLEVEELKRRLEVATRRAASSPGLEWLQSENDHLRQATQEAGKKAALALATEQLKRSELEAKLDNLLRMKEDFEFRTQNEIEQRSQEAEALRGQLRQEIEKTRVVQAEHEAVHAELERALVEKEQLEERLHSLESRQPEPAPAAAPAGESVRVVALEEDLGRYRAEAAEAQAALADAAAHAAVAEEALSREQQERAEDSRREQQLRREIAAKLQQSLEGREDAERRCERLTRRCDELESRANAGETARAAVAAEAEAAAAQASARASFLEAELRAGAGKFEKASRDLEESEQRAAALRGELAAARAECAGRSTSWEAELAAQRAEHETARQRQDELTARIGDLERGAAADADRIRELRTERDRLEGLLEEREQAFEAELGAAREHADAAARDLEARAAALRAESTAAAQAARLLEERAAAAEEAAREAGARLERAEAALASEQERSRDREREGRLLLESQQQLSRELEGRLAALAASGEGAKPVQAELHRIEELLEEVVSRARNEAVEHARRDAELTVRLQTALDDRRQLLERLDRAGAEAAERERRAASLLQSAIDRGPSQPQERANLPALVPLEAGSAPPPRRTALYTGIAVAALAVVLAFVGLRRMIAPAPRDSQPAVSRPQQEAAPAAGLTPRDVWDRWTRSDSSGGVLVQATLVSEQELRAEVGAERRSRGWSAEQEQIELSRRLGTFRFDSFYYVTVYLKNLSPGYPAYLEDLAGRFRLRDSAGHEASAVVPAGHEAERRVFTFGAGAPSELIYEATIPLGFPRTGLAPSPGYLQLVVSDVGTASRRVLTWELE